MKQSKIDKMRRCSQLLPPPGGEVVRSLLDEIERIQNEEPSKAMKVLLREVERLHLRLEACECRRQDN